MKFFRVFILIVVLARLLPAQNGTDIHQEVVQKMVETALLQRIDYQLLEDLCRIGPRLSGYPEAEKAIAWAVNALEATGCDSVWREPVEVPYWRRGTIEQAEIYGLPGPGKRPLSIAGLGRSAGTGGIVLTAGVVEVKPFSRLAELDSAIFKGKYIFFNEPFDQGLVRTFDAYSKAVQQRTKGPVAAARLGAAGAIVRSVTSRDDNVPHVGVTGRDSAAAPVPAVAIGVRDAEFLSAALQKYPDLRIGITLDCEDMGTAASWNVIGEIRGQVYPDEIVLIGGHFDAWDKGHGAHDNGAGCVQAMAVLSLFRKLGIRPKRTIRCVLFADEEQKQSGARRYAARSDSLKEYHLAAIESDRGGFTPRGFYVEADSTIITAMQKFLPYLSLPGIEWIRKGGSGADVSKLPDSTVKIGYVPDDQRYFDFHHSDNDTFDAVNPRELALGTASMAILAYLISEFGI